MPKSSRSAFSGQGRIAHHVTQGETTVVACLMSHFRVDEARARELLSLGAIYSNKRRVLEDRKLPKGEYLRIHLQPKRFPIEGVDWAKLVVAETKDFLVALKPAGLPAHATLDNARENLLEQLREHLGKRLLITQRLDTPVSGVMVLAKTGEFQRQFNFWLAGRKVEKQYRALVETAPPLGLLVHYMEPSEYGAKRVSLEERPSWLRCELTVKKVTPREIGRGERRRLFHDVTLDLHTGRTHQIRAQLSAIGCPIVGDRLYGSQARAPFESARETIALFSARVGFPGAKGEMRAFEAKPSWG